MSVNIIAHNCVGARLYQEKGQEYGNPFMWSIIPPDDFFYLYKHYNDLDFKNIELGKEGKDYKITIDGKVKVLYVHYRYDKDAHEPVQRIKDGVDIYYDKIEDYIIEKYNKRLERMKGKPIFIVDDREFVANKNCNFKRSDIIKYVNKNDCIVVTADKTIKGKNVFYMPNKKLDPEIIARIILKNTNII